MTDETARAAADESDAPKLEARVKWYSLAKGYGFLDADAVDDDVFVHHTALRGVDDLRPGERVRFVLVAAERGPAARDVDVLDAGD